MKKNFFFAILAIILFSVQTSFAQTVLKIGYTNADAVLSALPEAKQIETDLKAYQSQISKELETKQATFKQKYEDYVKTAEGLAQVIRQEREKELQMLNQQIQEFERAAQSEMQKKNQTMLAPVYEKIQKAIDEVAKAENFTYVFSSDASGFPILLFASPEFDITNKVIVKLGGKPLPKEEDKK
ncbi:MAG: OmpH family outer membrane protein [Bacteroidetes bacterium]|nr:MAG: OmpH family outer membrane protein [Bacteroidota bacterium]